MGKPKPGSFLQIASSLFMMLALFWLTISVPFVYAAEQAIKSKTNQATGTCEESNPFANTTEEKNESSTNAISEYLIDQLHPEDFFILIVKFYKCHPADTYFAFHSELISPPPEA